MQGYTKLYIGLQGVPGGFKGLHRLQGTTKASRATKGFKGLQTVRKYYERSQSVTKGYIGMQTVRGCYKVLQGVTEGYKRLLGVTKNYKMLQRVTKGYKGIGVTKGYK